MKVFTPPQIPTPKKHRFDGKNIFLSGTIDMGTPDVLDWQAEAIKLLEEKYKNWTEEVTVLNPRREDWDPAWGTQFEQPEAFQQMTWELDQMEASDIIIMNILPNSKSPITLLELGLFAKSGKLRVICPKEFYRSGNVHMICYRNNIPLYDTLEECIKSI